MVHTRKAGELPFDYDHTKETNKRNLNFFIFHQSQMWVAADVSARNCSAISRCPWIKAKQHFRSKKTTKKKPTPPHRFFLWRVRVGTEVNQLTVNKWLLWIWVKETGTLRNFIWLPLSLSHTHTHHKLQATTKWSQGDRLQSRLQEDSTEAQTEFGGLKFSFTE